MRIRVPISNREAASYIKLRRLGYSISIIAKFFGRSTSAIYRRIRKAIEYGILDRRDLRKIPNRTRKIARARMERTMLKMLAQWESWILGEGEEPP